GIHRVGEEVPGRGLNQKRRMADERDDGDGAIERNRALRRVVDARGPSGPRLPQHPWDSRKRLAGGAGWVEESPAVKVIACHVSSAPEPLQFRTPEAEARGTSSSRTRCWPGCRQ